MLREAGELPEGALIAHVVLDEPAKDVLAAWKPGDPVVRVVRAQVVPGPELVLVETKVDVTNRTVVERTVVEGMRPALSMHEAVMAVFLIKEHPDYIAALAQAGHRRPRQRPDRPVAGRRVRLRGRGRAGASPAASRSCASTTRTTATPGPIEGVIVHFDMGRGEVVEVIDHGVTPMPPEPRPLRRRRRSVRCATGVKPLEITQPEGPSFTVTGNLIEWQSWSLRVAFDPYEGLVLHQVGYEDGGRVRPILHRASIAEMVVPYGIPGEAHGWKNAFDAGEWGLGRMTQSLELGCDCLGEITYLDATFSNEQGEPWVIENAICLHEEDVGISWKHVDLWSGTHEVRRNRRMVISFISTVGNYEYGFYWYLYVDGTIQLEVKLTGIMSPMAYDPAGPPPEHAVVVAPGVAAPGAPAPVLRPPRPRRRRRHQPGRGGRRRRRPRPDRTTRGTTCSARWPRCSAASRRPAGWPTRPCRAAWKVTNPEVRNGLGQPVAYKLNPHMATPSMLAGPDVVGGPPGRASPATTCGSRPTRPRSAGPRGSTRTSTTGGDGLPAWTAADRDLTDTDVVLWYSFGVTHVPRPEDWPVMPVELAGFLLQPVGFFDRNPALDLPPPQDHCHPA